MGLLKAYSVALVINIFMLSIHYVFESPNRDLDFKILVNKYSKLISSVSSKPSNIMSPKQIEAERKKYDEMIKQQKKPKGCTSYDIKAKQVEKQPEPINPPPKESQPQPPNGPDYVGEMLLGLDLNRQFQFYAEAWPEEAWEEPVMGIIKDRYQCLFNDLYFLHNPDIIETQRNVLSDYSMTSVFRKHLGIIANPTLLTSNLTAEPNVPLSYNVTIMFTQYSNFHDHFLIGKEAICLFQLYNHILGREELIYKDRLSLNILQLEVSLQHTPCKDKIKSIKSFMLRDTNSCQQFFSYLDDSEYLEHKQLNISKYLIRSSREEPIALDPIEEMRLRRKYSNGQKCGTIIDEIIVQKTLEEQLSVQGHKFSLYAYVLIASTHPMIVYFREGQVEMKAENKSTFVDFNSFQADLNHVNITKQIIDQLVLLIGSVDPLFFPDPRTFELFRVNFLIDKNYNLYLISIVPTIETNHSSEDEKHEQFSVYKETLLLMHKHQKFRYRKLRTKILEQYLNSSITEYDRLDLSEYNINGLVEHEGQFKLILNHSKEQTAKELCNSIQN